jgi:RNA polymerase sigma-70 factor (ECF subfamily)
VTESDAARHSREWFQDLYERHFDFVWRTLRHLGVREADLPDACQDAFLVVYRRFPSFEARGKVTTWMFQICFNLARDRRRRAHGRNETQDELAIDAAPGAGRDPHAEVEHKDKLALLQVVLDGMEVGQRAAFILFELEGMTGPEAAAAMDVPLSTAYSRQRLARAAFRSAMARARAAREPARRRGSR